MQASKAAGSWASLRFAVDSADEANGARMQRVQERATDIGSKLIFFELEWAALDDADAEALLADERLAFCDHWLRSARRYRPHLLSEPEEKLLADKRVTGAGAWSRLFSELSSAIEVEVPDVAGGDPSTTATASLEAGLSLLMHPDRDVRRRAAEGVTAGLAPGLRTRAYVFNTLLADKASDDRLRSYDSWVSSDVGGLGTIIGDRDDDLAVDHGEGDVARLWAPVALDGDQHGRCSFGGPLQGVIDVEGHESIPPGSRLLFLGRDGRWRSW